MGYTTEFTGFFTITPPLEGAPKAILRGLPYTRRVAREMDPKYGVEGEYYVGRQEEGRLLDENRPPRTQPSLWCDWELSEDGSKLQWNRAEKTYCYTEWLRYIITRVIPEGTVLNGKVQFQGEDDEDKGVIEIVDNRIRVIPHGGEQLRPASLDVENICREFQSAVPLILESLEHYRRYYDYTLGLPLKVDHYIAFIQNVAALHNCTLPQREWITGEYGDVTQAVHFCVLLNPKITEQDVQNVLSAYNNLFGVENEPRRPKVSLLREHYKTSKQCIKILFRCPWGNGYVWSSYWRDLIMKHTHVFEGH